MLTTISLSGFSNWYSKDVKVFTHYGLQTSFILDFNGRMDFPGHPTGSLSAIYNDDQSVVDKVFVFLIFFSLFSGHSWVITWIFIACYLQ